MPVGKKVMKARAAAKKYSFKYETTEVPEIKTGKYYPAEDVPTKKGPKPVRNAPKVRASIAPGKVLILLAGRFRGKRVVCLKQLSSGLLLVTGPYKSNGVPLRRVNQRYVIATSTSVPLKGVDVSKIDDEFFKREKKSSEAPTATVTSPERKKAQDTVDNALKANIDEVMNSYLSARFTLTNNDKPHAMKF
mmetsp:Transcript_104475/g.294443  ORF Transcript_104475/g.294443 Transcript_104475/m.294443 type:complete len:191 (+) Transcript_104475:32-604(+)